MTAKREMSRISSCEIDPKSINGHALVGFCFKISGAAVFEALLMGAPEVSVSAAVFLLFLSHRGSKKN